MKNISLEDLVTGVGNSDSELSEQHQNELLVHKKENAELKLQMSRLNAEYKTFKTNVAQEIKKKESNLNHLQEAFNEVNAELVRCEAKLAQRTEDKNSEPLPVPKILCENCSAFNKTPKVESLKENEVAELRESMRILKAENSELYVELTKQREKNQSMEVSSSLNIGIQTQLNESVLSNKKYKVEIEALSATIAGLRKQLIDTRENAILSENRRQVAVEECTGWHEKFLNAILERDKALETVAVLKEQQHMLELAQSDGRVRDNPVSCFTGAETSPFLTAAEDDVDTPYYFKFEEFVRLKRENKVW